MDTIKRWISQRSFSKVFCCCGSIDSRSVKSRVPQERIGRAIPVPVQKSLSPMECQETSYLSQFKELLPGIPDDVTLTHVVTKLPWTAFHVLVSVNLRWQQAIQSRQVYDARVRSNSTETLVAVKYLDSRLLTAISLYSMREKAFYNVPTVPRDFPNLFSYRDVFPRLVSVSGRLYVLGADRNESMCVLDLAGQKQWEQCASIQEPEREYSITIGCANWNGDSLSVWGGDVDWFESSRCSYHLVEGEWRTRRPPWRNFALDTDARKNFIVQGQHYCMRKNGKTHDIYVRDIRSDTNSWRHQHSISCEEPGSELGFIDIILPVNSELLAIASWNRDHGHGYCLVQSIGFGTASKEIVWQKAPDSFHFDEPYYSLPLVLCPIQL